MNHNSAAGLNKSEREGRERLSKEAMVHPGVLANRVRVPKHKDQDSA